LSPNPDERPQRGQEVVSELTEIIRQHGLESSNQKIADYLASVLPDQIAEASGTTVKQIVRVYPEDGARSHASASIRAVGDHATIDKSPVSIPPSSVTPSAATSARMVDISETYRRSPIPTTPRQPRVTIERVEVEVTEVPATTDPESPEVVIVE